MPAGRYGFIRFHFPSVPASTVVAIENTLGSWNGSFDNRPSVWLHIPEPMTLSLLGLGGLFMVGRRRVAAGNI